MIEKNSSEETTVRQGSFVGGDEQSLGARRGCSRSNGAAWTAVFIAVPAGLLAAIFAMIYGSGPLRALIWYSAIGGLCFAVSLAKLYFSIPWTDEDLPVARPIVQLHTSELKNKIDPGNQTTWVQKNPNGHTISHERVFCVGGVSNSSTSTLIAELVADCGYGVDLCNCLTTAISTIVMEPQLWHALFVDLDECEHQIDIDDIVSVLSTFRVAAPKVSVILCSSSFARDDLGSERLSVTDISLRMPISPRRILESFAVAYSNNQEWQARQHGNTRDHCVPSAIVEDNVVDLRDVASISSPTRSKATFASGDL